MRCRHSCRPTRPPSRRKARCGHGNDNRKAECGNGDPKQRGPNCRQREIDEKDAADKLAAATAAKVATERAGRLETAMAVIRQRLASEGPVVTVNVQGSALARLFRLPDTEADFAATVQQFGMAAIVELLIAFALIAWEMLRPPVVDAKKASEATAAPSDSRTSPIEIAEPRPYSERCRSPDSYRAGLLRAVSPTTLLPASKPPRAARSNLARSMRTTRHGVGDGMSSHSGQSCSPRR